MFFPVESLHIVHYPSCILVILCIIGPVAENRLWNKLLVKRETRSFRAWSQRISATKPPPPHYSQRRTLMNGRALCFLQTVLLGFREGAIQSRSATSKQNRRRAWKWKCFKAGGGAGVAAVLRPATPLLPPPPPEIQCKQGLQRAAGNTLLTEGVWQRVKVIAALLSAAELTRLVCGRFESKRARLLQWFQTAVLVLHHTLVFCGCGGWGWRQDLRDVWEAWKRIVNTPAKSRRNLDGRPPSHQGFALVTVGFCDGSVQSPVASALT